MLNAVSRAFFHTLAGSRTLNTLASRYGLRDSTSFARRFVAGENVEEAIASVRAIEARGLLHTLDMLGESVSSSADALAAAQGYVDLIRSVTAAGVGRNFSLKLSHIGLAVDRATCVDNLRRILEPAQRDEFFIRIDMEGSATTDVTLDIFETMWGLGYRNIGAVVQAYLYRSEEDIRRLNRLNARVRLVKGAYKEPKRVALQHKREIDAAFVHLMRILLTEGTYPAIATHDPAMIAATQVFAHERSIPARTYEFQMLYGVRRDLQSRLATAGHPFRVYVPFGHEWFPYFMRRLGERPANGLFVLRVLLGENSFQKRICCRARSRQSGTVKLRVRPPKLVRIVSRSWRDAVTISWGPFDWILFKLTEPTENRNHHVQPPREPPDPTAVRVDAPSDFGAARADRLTGALSETVGEERTEGGRSVRKNIGASCRGAQFGPTGGFSDARSMRGGTLTERALVV